jgi:HNH endonuclease
MTSFNPIRRSPLKPKARKAKSSAPWRQPKVRLDGKGMAELRAEAFLRSEAQCENSIDGRRCRDHIGWINFQLHHIQHRSRGGSDVISNVLCACFTCHKQHHDGVRRIVPHWEAKP